MDCKDTLFPIARKTPNRVFMCFPLIFGWPLFLYNVKTTLFEWYDLRGSAH